GDWGRGVNPDFEKMRLAAPHSSRQMNGILSGIVTGIVGGVDDVLDSCGLGCWAAYPPFSGEKDARKACLQDCKAAGNGGGFNQYPPPYYHQPPNMVEQLLPIAAVGVGLYLILKK